MKFKAILLFLLFTEVCSAQMISIYENVGFRHFDRYVYANDSFHTSVRPYLMNQINPIVNIDTLFKIKTNSKFLGRILNKNLVEMHKGDVWFAINPHIAFEAGKSSTFSEKSTLNTRGFILTGGIGKNVNVVSTFRENQAFFNDYRGTLVNKLSMIPGQGTKKDFKDGGADWGNVTALVSYSPSKHFNFQLGNDKTFFGEGYRSLLLSDNAAPYPFFKITTDFWKIKYVNLWAQLTDMHQPYTRDMGYAKKWCAIQYLSYNTTKWLNISAFESVMWANSDSLEYRGFDFSYANPVIFIRPVEFLNGSPDNVMMGANAKITLLKKYIFYAQAMIDEFNLAEIKANNGFWSNKYGYQLGFKTFDIAKIKHLDFQTEYNRVRPFTYSHWSTLQCYGHFNQPLAHPLGANFEEFTVIARYNIKRFFFDTKFTFASFGTSTKKFNAGENVFADYTKNRQDYGNFLGQGVKNNLAQAELYISFLINPSYNLNIFGGFVKRIHKVDATTDNQNFINFGIRTSLDNIYFDF